MQWNEFIRTDRTYTGQEWPYRVGKYQLRVNGSIKLMKNNGPIAHEPIELLSDSGQNRITLNGNSDKYELMKIDAVVKFSDTDGDCFPLSELAASDNLDAVMVFCSKSSRYYHIETVPFAGGVQASFSKILINRDDIFESLTVQTFLVLREDSQNESNREGLKKGSVVSFSRDIEILTDAKHNLFTGGIGESMEEFSGSEKYALYKISIDTESQAPYIIWNERYDTAINFLKQPKQTDSANDILQNMILRMISYEIYMQTLAGAADPEFEYDDLEQDSIARKILDNSSKYIGLKGETIFNDIRGDFLKLEESSSLIRLQSGLKIGQLFNKYLSASEEESVLIEEEDNV